MCTSSGFFVRVAVTPAIVGNRLGSWGFGQRTRICAHWYRGQRLTRRQLSLDRPGDYLKVVARGTGSREGVLRDRADIRIERLGFRPIGSASWGDRKFEPGLVAVRVVHTCIRAAAGPNQSGGAVSGLAITSPRTAIEGVEMPRRACSRWYVVSEDNESETGPYDSRRQAQGVQLLVERTHLVYRDDALELRRFAPLLWPAHPVARAPGPIRDRVPVANGLRLFHR
jgi:hypothetical protein